MAEVVLTSGHIDLGSGRDESLEDELAPGNLQNPRALTRAAAVGPDGDGAVGAGAELVATAADVPVLGCVVVQRGRADVRGTVAVGERGLRENGVTLSDHLKRVLALLTTDELVPVPHGTGCVGRDGVAAL